MLNKRQFIACLILLGFFAFPFWSFAVSGNCTGYAWGENIGWINFNPKDGGGATVSNDGLTGYIWAENFGWIKLDYDGVAGALNTTSTDWGVTNDGYGNLGGYAWAENVGWINFHSSDSQVTIDSNGNFSGYAWAENVGWIEFDHAQTNYRPATTWSVPVSSSQSHFRIYNDDGTVINDATALVGEDANYNIGLNTNFRIRFETANVGTSAINISRRLEFREYSGGSWGAWTQITTNSNNVRLVDSLIFTDGDATSSRLTAVGTFMAGQGKDTGSDTSSISLTNGYYTEDEYSLKFQAGAGGNTYQFRITNAGAALDNYTATPSISPGAVSILQIKGGLRVKGTMRVK